MQSDVTTRRRTIRTIIRHLVEHSRSSDRARRRRKRRRKRRLGSPHLLPPRHDNAPGADGCGSIRRRLPRDAAPDQRRDVVGRRQRPNDGGVRQRRPARTFVGGTVRQKEGVVVGRSRPSSSASIGASTSSPNDHLRARDDDCVDVANAGSDPPRRHTSVARCSSSFRSLWSWASWRCRRRQGWRCRWRRRHVEGHLTMK